jgi:hypothetical protein
MMDVLGLQNLQGTYEASGAAPHITLDATGGGFTIRDNATPLAAVLFAVEDNGGDNVLDVQVAQTIIRGMVPTDAAIATVARVVRDAGNAVADDGVALDWALTNSVGAEVTALQFAVEWSNSTSGAETSETVFSSRVAGAFLEALRFRNVGANTAIVTPLGLTLNPNGDTDDGLQLLTVANNTYVLPLTPTRSFYFGNTQADPTIDLDRNNARCMDLIPLGTTLTSASPGEWVNFSSTIILDYASNSIGGLIAASGIFQFNQAGNGFGAGNLFKNQATFKNQNSVVASFGSQYTFVNTATYQADGAAISSLFWRCCLFQTAFNVINAGTLAITTCNPGGFINPNIGAGVTITNLRHWEFAAGTYNGTVTDNDLIYFSAITGGTNMSGIRSLIAAAANRYFIRHTGTAQSLFGGDVEIDGDLNHDGTNVGFYGTAPVTQAANIPALTDNSGGTANDTIAAITQAANAGSADVGPTADAIADLAAKVNAILAVLDAATGVGLTA